jgi:radical SAM superfamily enzyme YgiQ (UPF0313 family)
LQVLVSLIFPPLSEGHDDRRSPPLGIAYLAAALREVGVECELLDGNSGLPTSSIDSIVAHVLDIRPDIVGLSVTTPAFGSAVQIVQEIERRVSAFIVFGGHHATALHEEILQAHGCIDAVVRGEGERAFPELVEARLAGRSLAGIQGVSYREADGRIVINPCRPPIEDLDSLPFPVRAGSLFTYPRYLDACSGRHLVNVPVLSSRGCPYQCVFCAVQSFYDSMGEGKRWRPRDPKEVAREIRAVSEFEREIFVHFVDDNFLVEVKRAIAVAEEMEVQCGTRIPFTFATRADQVLAAGREVISTLAQLGCEAIEIGIENGCDSMLSLFST